MAKPNYAFAKRQRDVAKQQKKQEKEKRKSAARNQAIDEERREADPGGKPEPPISSTLQ